MVENENALNEIENIIKKEKSKQKDLNDSINYVDLDNIQTENVSVISQQESLKSIFGARPSFQVVCAQSGYMAKMSALIYKDIVTLLNSNLSNYENKREIYKIIYSKVVEFSAENWHPSFEDWLKMTSLGDVETLLYGIYSATFQEKSTIRFTCPYCENEETVTIDNRKLVRVEDKKEMLQQTKLINKEAGSLDKIKELSLVFDKKENCKNVQLPDSGIIFSIKLPSLYKTLEILKEFSDEELADMSVDALNIMLSTTKVLIPNKDKSTYSLVDHKSDVSGIIDLLSVNDISIVRNVVTNLLNDKHISYYLENQKCSSCGNNISKIPMDIESLLFFQISEKQLS